MQETQRDYSTAHEQIATLQNQLQRQINVFQQAQEELKNGLVATKKENFEFQQQIDKRTSE